MAGPHFSIFFKFIGIVGVEFFDIVIRYLDAGRELLFDKIVDDDIFTGISA
jgi:hypothetical protein